MSLQQYNGANVGNYEDVYYAGTNTLTLGAVVGFALDDTANPTTIPAGALVVPPTSNVLARDLRGRQVKDIGTDNAFTVAGIVTNLRNLVNGVGPGWIEIQKPVVGDIVDIYCKFSAAKNSDIVGSSTGGGAANLNNIAVSLSTAGTYSGSGRVLAIAIETVDRSTTAGLVKCKFI